MGADPEASMSLWSCFGLARLLFLPLHLPSHSLLNAVQLAALTSGKRVQFQPLHLQSQLVREERMCRSPHSVSRKNPPPDLRTAFESPAQGVGTAFKVKFRDEDHCF